MEIRGMLNFLTELMKYIKERFNVSYLILFPLYFIVAITLGKFNLLSLLMIVVFLFYFRLLDDLSDLVKDRSLYPERVLSKSSYIKEFNSLLLLLSLILFFLVFKFSDKNSMKFYLPLLTILSFYRHKTSALSWIHFQLIKYPMLFLLLGLQGFFALSALYSGFCAYEFFHDHSYGLVGKKLFVCWIGIMTFFIVAHVVF